MSRYRTKAGLLKRCMAARLAQSREHWPCKRGVPGSSPGLAAHFSPPGDNGAQRRAVTLEVLHRTCPWVCRDQYFTVPCYTNSRTNSNLAGENVTVPNSSGIGGKMCGGPVSSVGRALAL
ncbi:hypothetical protein DPMN_186089 [Dreissena polymorpha]|uniref:Uncharacterized protein n=1 Tax=Dreissena polymorpha TaxID=45954 RepID=A0A9D4DM41_DREPO|nr:hypothetical protein DPMN_186089 [Dreissena polymorpha]